MRQPRETFNPDQLVNVDTVLEYSPLIIPSAYSTKDYEQILMGGAVLLPEEKPLGPNIASRELQERLRLGKEMLGLAREHPDARRTLIGEAALHQVVGGKDEDGHNLEVQRGAVLHVARLAVAGYPVRVVPYEADIRGVRGGFMVVHHPDQEGMVVEFDRAGDFPDTDTHLVRQTTETFDYLWDQSLGGQAMEDRLHEVASQLE